MCNPLSRVQNSNQLCDDACYLVAPVFNLMYLMLPNLHLQKVLKKIAHLESYYRLLLCRLMVMLLWGGSLTLVHCCQSQRGLILRQFQQLQSRYYESNLLPLHDFETEVSQIQVLR